MKTSHYLLCRSLQKRSPMTTRDGQLDGFGSWQRQLRPGRHTIMVRWAQRCFRLIVFVVFIPFAAWGDLSIVQTDESDGRSTTFKMTVTPAAEPVPALKYRLMLREIDLKQGNAAPYYYRALLDMPTVQNAMNESFGEDYHEWYRQNDLALGELPLERVREAVSLLQGSPMENLRTAAGRRRCDWGWNTENIHGTELISFLLDEVQRSRWLCRVLMLQARLAMATGDIDKAIDLLRINYRLARDIAKEPILVCDLVGIAIASLGNWSVIELISQPGAPNLYWALAELPRPLIGIRQSIRAEMSLGLRMFPFLLDAETAEHSPEEWARLLTEGLMDIESLEISRVDHGLPTADVRVAQLGVMAMSVAVYPGAKQRLVDSGMDPQRIEQMPVGQVVAIDSLREYRRISDEEEKWQYVPYGTMGQSGEPDLFWKIAQSGPLTRGYGYVAATLILPAVQAARSAEQRILWQMDAIRTVEAIRMHAAASGQLPRTLDEVRVVPVPLNPATDQPFAYDRNGDTAVLDLPFSDGIPGQAYRFEITLSGP